MKHFAVAVLVAALLAPCALDAQTSQTVQGTFNVPLPLPLGGTGATTPAGLANNVGTTGTITSSGTQTVTTNTVLWSPSPCGNGTVNLPASPVDNEPHTIVNVGSCPSNAMTISGNGHQIGLVSSIVSVTPGATAVRYSAATGSWGQVGAAGVVAGPTFTGLNAANNLSDVASESTALSNLSGQAHVTNVATLRGLSTTNASIFLSMFTDGYTTAGDGGGARFQWNPSSTCTDDGGSCIEPNSAPSTGRWITQFPASGTSPMQWGCAGNGTTNDSACISAVLNSSVGHIVLGDHMYGMLTGVTLNVSNKVITGNQSGFNINSEGNGATSGFTDLATNLTLFTVPSTVSSVTFEKFFVAASAAGLNTSGATFLFSNSNNDLVRDVVVSSPCLGFDVSGNSITLDHVNTTLVMGNGCGSVRVGHLTTDGETVDPRIINSTFQSNTSNPASFGIRIEDAGGMFMANNDNLFAQVGTYSFPAAGQKVMWLFGVNTVLGDTTVDQANLIDTANSAGTVEGWTCENCWASSSSTSNGFQVNNTASGTVTGIYTTNLKVFNNGESGVQLNAGTDIEFDGLRACGNSVSAPATFNGIGLVTGISHVRIIGGQSGACNGLPTQQASGIVMLGSNTNIVMDGFDVSTGNTTGFNFGSGVLGFFTNNPGFNTAAGP